MSDRDQFEAWARSIGYKDEFYFFTNAHPNHYDDDRTEDMWAAWQASREALKSEQGEDGWIACADRMPEEIGRYWCSVEEQNSLGKSHYQWNCAWNGKRWWVEHEDGGRVTHWQPLPSPPAVNHPIDTTPNQYDALGKGGEQGIQAIHWLAMRNRAPMWFKLLVLRLILWRVATGSKKVNLKFHA